MTGGKMLYGTAVICSRKKIIIDVVGVITVH